MVALSYVLCFMAYANMIYSIKQLSHARNPPLWDEQVVSLQLNFLMFFVLWHMLELDILNKATMRCKESPLWDKIYLNKQIGNSFSSYYWDCIFCGVHGPGTLTRLITNLARVKGEGIEKWVQVT